MSNSAKFLPIAGAFAAAAILSAHAEVDTDQVTVTGATGSSVTQPAVKVTGDGGVYFSAGNSTSLPGISSGNGLLFVPAKSALIVGNFNSYTLANISSGSIVAGSAAFEGGQVSNQGGLAVGFSSSASGLSAVALGDSAVADSFGAVAAAGGNALAVYSFAASGGTALGYNSTALGMGTVAQAGGACVVGYYNVAEGDPGDNEYGGHPDDPLFVVGNGYISSSNFEITRSNAFTVYRNGQIKIKEPQGDILMGDFN